MIAPTLRGSRLTLRQLHIEDAVPLFDVLSDETVMRFWSSGPHSSVEETRLYLEWNADSDAEHLCWAITRHDGPALGWVILVPRRDGVFELGYILGRADWGMGLVQEAVNMVLDYAFGPHGSRRIMADTDPENIASIRLLEKLGFRQEGHLRAEWETHIGIRDSLIFGLLQHEWESGQA